MEKLEQSVRRERRKKEVTPTQRSKDKQNEEKESCVVVVFLHKQIIPYKLYFQLFFFPLTMYLGHFSILFLIKVLCFFHDCLIFNSLNVPWFSELFLINKWAVLNFLLL